MKISFLAVTLLAVLSLGARDLQAQAYGPYYGPYWDSIQYQQALQHQQYLDYLQQYDPYYQLHLMHYQLYLQPYQPYLYQPCCYAWGAIVPHSLAPISVRPRAVIVPREQVIVSPLPRAVTPLPRAVSPRVGTSRTR
jgi:hypothetical protein